MSRAASRDRSHLRTRIRDHLRTLWQYPCPTHLLSRLVCRATRIHYRPVKDRQILWFLRRYRVDMDIAVAPAPSAYLDFNSFFTRALRPDARPVNDEAHALVSPVDGEISQAGTLHGEQLLQAKGKTYSLRTLLGGKEDDCRAFVGGEFFTAYLHPRNYHRVHMPARGCLQTMIYIPGRLFSVNASSAQTVPHLFARNERVVCIFRGDRSVFAVVLVGALCVGHIETAWAGAVTPKCRHRPARWSYAEGSAPALERGAELGRFNMGSTVIVLLPPGQSRWRAGLGPGQQVHVGEKIGEFLPSSTGKD
ncbi:MAG: phosphatidylserine decarboxylase [Gammaproteobacteria bacterium]|nr:phosphatidylserine decarboxylase [Gammaproteobacteria bacterium]NIR82800.1 phosphatidylserine decarboxylase [Gammaproteobacteria bacterium]NIR89909.1 phosphatidylserine decarboxylase [Gammaproteobacteria bacterium]NIU03958.1 phosphatidylserine decarboxylase [Gammaproteobacteria bacterium]NIV51278.1 phosphatidylserine decarboxylase [Gammaproteobacteria bacterium]